MGLGNIVSSLKKKSGVPVHQKIYFKNIFQKIYSSKTPNTKLIKPENICSVPIKTKHLFKKKHSAKYSDQYHHYY